MSLTADKLQAFPHPTVFITLLSSLLRACKSWSMLSVARTFAHVHVLTGRLLKPEVTTHKSVFSFFSSLNGAFYSPSLPLSLVIFMLLKAS